MSRGPWLGRLALVLVSLLLGLAAAEGFLRWRERRRAAAPSDLRAALADSERSPLGQGGEGGRLSLHGMVRPSADPDLVYELKPGLDGLFRGQRLRTNSEGMRGAEVERAKPLGVYRLAGLGDSVMFGWGVGEGEPYLQVLERRLDQGAPPGRRYQTLNFAVPGYNTFMEAAAGERKALPFAPDLILIHFVRNDLGLPHLMLPPDAAATGERLLLVDFLRRLGDASGAPDDADPFVHDLGELSPAERDATRGAYGHMAGREAYLGAMARLAAISRARAIPVVVMTQKRGPHRDLVAEAVAAHGLRWLDPTPVFHRYLADQGLPDTRESWRRFSIPRDNHPTPLAHRLLAEALLEELQAMGIVPRTGDGPGRPTQ